MFRVIVRRIIIFWGIIALFFLLFLLSLAFFSGELHADLFGIADGYANIGTWLDMNANGIHEGNEPALPGVCVFYETFFDSRIKERAMAACTRSDFWLTDEQGQFSDFVPGSTCEYLLALPPDGYQPTTNMAVKECAAEFGFVQQDAPVNRDILTIETFVRRELTKIWIKRVAIGLLILSVAFAGTIWLEKHHA